MRPITAADLMNPGVLTVPEDMTVRELADFLVANEISGAPVTDVEGRVLGVVSLADVAQAVARGDEIAADREPDRRGPAFYHHDWDGTLHRDGVETLDPDLLVGDIMTADVHSVDVDTAVSQIASTLIARRVHRILVTREGRVVGIITTSDLLGLLVDEPEA